MTWLIRLYPGRWRERYGGELEQLVADLGPDGSPVSIAADLVKGAFVAHVREGMEMPGADRRAIRRGALIAGATWLGLSVEIVITNVVAPSTTDDDAVLVLLSYLGVFAVLFLSGKLAARDGAGRTGQLLAGLVAGALIGALTTATFAVVDNVWLDVVAQQPAKIDGFAQSGAGSMRAYVNHGLIGTAVFFTAGFGVAGAVLSRWGGLLDRTPLPSTPARRRRR